MTWFKVDDSFHAHPKVLATEPAALGLWVVAGAWSSAHLTDGFVPTHALLRLLPGSDALAKALVAAGLWRRAKGGYQFHDWSAYQPSADDVKSMREKRAVAGRLGGKASGLARLSTGRSDKKARMVDADKSDDKGSELRGSRSKTGSKAEALASPVVEPPARPDPTFIGGALTAPLTPGARGAPPPSKCPDHEHLDEPPPCGRCADLRRAHTRWDLADAERRRNIPHCRRHRGQPAGNCGPCRSEALAIEETP